MAPNKEVTKARLEQFANLFNRCYPKHTVRGSTDRPLRRNDMDLRWTEKYTARLAVGGDEAPNLAFLYLNKDWWGQASDTERVVTLVHQITHMQTVSHGPEFWKEFAQNIDRIHGKQSYVEHHGFPDVDWNDFIRQAVEHPTTEIVDCRRDTAYERRLFLADKLDYPVDKVDFLDGISVVTEHPFKDGFEIVPLDDVEYESYSEEEMLEYFYEYGREGMEFDSDRDAYAIGPVEGVHLGDGQFKVTDGDIRAAVADAKGIRRICIELQD